MGVWSETEGGWQRQRDAWLKNILEVKSIVRSRQKGVVQDDLSL